MRVLRYTIAAIFGAAALWFAVTAHAAPLPKVYAEVTGWTHPSVRPAWIYIGQGGAPYVHTWHWSSWKASYAYSKGTLYTDNCVPNCALAKTAHHSVDVTLSQPRTHTGVLYYSRMTWYSPDYKFPPAYKHAVTLNFGDGGFWR
jgi:hypothetical protein